MLSKLCANNSLFCFRSLSNELSQLNNILCAVRLYSHMSRFCLCIYYSHIPAHMKTIENQIYGSLKSLTLSPLRVPLSSFYQHLAGSTAATICSRMVPQLICPLIVCSFLMHVYSLDHLSILSIIFA